MLYTRRRVILLILLIVSPFVIIAFRAWRKGGINGGQKYAEPFRIAGNLYYIGANDVTSFLITGPQGHVLIDGGYPGTAKMIMASVKQLGFDIRDVKILLNSEPHYDHAGGLGEIQQASGAKMYASEASADALESGGDDRNNMILVRMIAWSGLARYPRLHVERRFKDGDTIRLGSTEIIAHITPGHTRGCTSYEIPLNENGRKLTAVSACSLVAMAGMGYLGHEPDFNRSYRVLRSIPADIWVTSHGRLWSRYRKFSERAKAANPVDPFIDPQGYRAYIDSAEAEFKRGVRH